MTAISLFLFVFYPSLQRRRSRQDAKMPDFCAIVYLRSKAYCLMGLEAFCALALAVAVGISFCYKIF
jgi:hypothetical protein